MKNKIVAIVQARMNSTRLPGKALLPLARRSSLWWVCKRASLAKLVDEVVVATTAYPSNDAINAQCIPRDCYITRYHGNEDDVIGRVLAAAKWAKCDVIVDISGDCVMADPRHIDYLIEMLIHKEFNWDYVSNDVVSRSWADGLDIQIYYTRILQECKDLFAPKTHCGWNIAQYPEAFNIHYWRANSDMHWPELGLTLDTPEDYVMLSRLFDKFSGDLTFHVEDVIRFLRMNPDWITNTNVRRKMPEEG